MWCSLVLCSLVLCSLVLCSLVLGNPRLCRMCRMAGMSDQAYWLASGIFCFLLSFGTTLMLYGFAFLFSVATYVVSGTCGARSCSLCPHMSLARPTVPPRFKNAAFSLFFLLALLWAMASTGYAFVMGATVRSSKAATVLVRGPVDAETMCSAVVAGDAQVVD